jgi:Tfp pilus assembly pilus retraction ATPase PilT
MTLALLRDFKITDLYIRLDGKAPAIYQGQKRGKNRVNALVPEQYNDDVKKLTEFAKSDAVNEDGITEFEGIRFRLSRQHMADGEEWMCLRVIKTHVPPLDKLGIMPGYVKALRDLGQRDGLVLLTGATGHGKTTTAASLVTDYLAKHGGVCVTIEDPVEYVLKGRHGEKGFCFQSEVQSDEEWAPAIKRSLRWAPYYIFVGEIRTGQAAEQLLRAATTGHLVITTLHAGSPEEALMGLIHMAEQTMGSGGAMHILAAGITAVVHQTMTEQGPNVRMCVAESGNMGDPLRALIRENRIGMLTTYIDKMAARVGRDHSGMQG